MYKHIFLNPFYWYAFIWSFILLFSLCAFSAAYGTVSVGAALFLLFTIVISAVSGYFYAKYLKKVKIEYQPPRHVWMCLAVIVIAFVADFIYAQSVPLWNELTNSVTTYKDFNCFPVLHEAVFTFSSYYAVHMFYHFLEERDIKKRLTYLGIIAVILMFFLGLYNRAALMMIAFMCVVIYLSHRKKIRAWHIVAVIAFALVGLFLFGVMGNVRSGDA